MLSLTVTGPYTPPACNFTRVILNLTVSSAGVQYDRLAELFIGDSQVWQTSTAEPKAKPGIAWTTWKEATPFLALWKKPQQVTFDLANIVNDQYTGSYTTTLTATFLNDDLPADAAGATPADQIVGVSSHRSNGVPQTWNYPSQKIESSITVPQNLKRAVFTVAATGQSQDEFWWSNPPDEAIPALGTTDWYYKSGFREVRLRIDGKIAGLSWPFPVVFTGGISPPLHRPVVGIQAFDLLESEIDITPWLGVLCDGKPHTFGLEVVGQNDKTGVNTFWLLTGKLFLWLDKEGSVTTGDAPEVTISPNNFNAGMGRTCKNKASWKQTASRNFQVKGQIQRGGKTISSTWTQSMSMTNNGFVKGPAQIVDAHYSGQDSIVNDGETGYESTYSYPIFMDYREIDNTTVWKSKADTELTQGYTRSVTGASVYSNGLEPFVKSVPDKLTGSYTNTLRDSHGSIGYYVNGTRVITGSTDQQWTLNGQVQSKASGSDSVQLYSRHLSVQNEVFLFDDVFLYGNRAAANLAAPVKPTVPDSESGDFAFRPFRPSAHNQA